MVEKVSHVIDGVTLTAQWPTQFRVVEITGTTPDMSAANLKALLQSNTCNRAKVKQMIVSGSKVYAEMESAEGLMFFCLVLISIETNLFYSCCNCGFTAQ